MLFKGVYLRLNYVFLIVLFVSCKSSKVGDKAMTSVDRESLVRMVYNELELDESEVQLYDIKRSLNNSNEVIIVLAESENEEEEEERYTSHIVIVDGISGKIRSHFTEDSNLNGWISNAVFIDNIHVDSTNYLLTKTKEGFGVRIKFRNMSQPNPYSEERISLFVKDNNQLKKVLDAYTIHESIGEVNVNTNVCFGVFKIFENKIAFQNSSTNGYYDILVNKIETQRNFQKDESNECNPLDKVVSKKKIILKFDGKAYH
ncbi:PA3715 family protein [Tenacibaculum xiamenense]|uniref:hypothetical protein n=1 Tax=Tenacibaculum xiamenense TaxID=1261553 RepID=UPI003892CDA6